MADEPKAIDQIEPAAAETHRQMEATRREHRALPPPNANEISLQSIAISLKRIADTLGTLSTESCNHYGETILPALTRAISDGIAGR